MHRSRKSGKLLQGSLTYPSFLGIKQAEGFARKKVHCLGWEFNEIFVDRYFLKLN